MNPQINKVANDIQKTKAKIAELQALLPELEKKKTDLENAEIVKLVRKASVEPGKLAEFLDSIKRLSDQNKPTSVQVAGPPAERTPLSPNSQMQTDKSSMGQSTHKTP